MRRCLLTVVVTVMPLLGLVMPAEADPVVYSDLIISNIGGGWTNVNPGDISALSVDNSGSTDTIRWGQTEIMWNGQMIGAGGTGQSGYDFAAAGDLSPVPLDVAFLLGTFEHINQPVYGSFLSSVDYEFSFMTNGSPSPLSTTFSFEHTETLNVGPCASGPAGMSQSMCDDFVSVSSSGLNSSIMFGTTSYLFELLGFSTDGGLTTTSMFQSPEMQTNQAGLYARLTFEGVVAGVTDDPQPVPEPGTLLLLGVGLAACGLGRRRLRLRFGRPRRS